jgi:hypothetical protein
VKNYEVFTLKKEQRILVNVSRVYSRKYATSRVSTRYFLPIAVMRGASPATLWMHVKSSVYLKGRSANAAVAGSVF